MHDLVVRDLVLIGGGHSHAIVLRRFGMKPLPGLRITVVARDVDTPYSGMLPGFVAGHYGFDDVHIDLGPLCRFAGARLVHAAAVGLDLERRRVRCADHPDVPYDVLSINTGSTPATLGTPGASDHATPVKPISGFVARWEELVARVRSSERPLDVAVVGAGAGGVELVLAMHHALGGNAKSSEHPVPRFTLFSGSDEILPTHPEGVRRRFDRLLERRGVAVQRGAHVVDVSSDAVVTADAQRHPADHVLWVTDAGAAPWLGESGLDVDERGFVKVHATLESTSHPGVFAAGDVAHVVEHPREKAGVFAVRQGPPLEANLRRAARGVGLRPFRPQRRFLTLISSGDRYAVGSRGGKLVFAGRWVWRWKDWIDRRFMQRFAELPTMAVDVDAPRGGLVDATTAEAVAMSCAGCGAKLGATALERALAKLPVHRRDDVLVGLDAPDDAAVLDVPDGHVVVQTVDALRPLVDDPYAFGRIAAEHALGDVYAMGADPQAAMAIVTLPFGVGAKSEELLEPLMAGVARVVADAGATLVGGHTSEGPEMSVGLSAQGLAPRDAVIPKRGLRPGDALVLTKSLGVGTLFAAHMRAKAKGRWITAAVASMQRSHRAAPAILRAHEAHAATDVTGFGLAGHLLEMLRGTDVGVELDLAALPVLDGALSTLRAGLVSSLQPDNLAARDRLGLAEGVDATPRAALLFDPQTAGGLLFGVPAERAADCVEAFVAEGLVDTAVVGRVETRAAGAPRLRLVGLDA